MMMNKKDTTNRIAKRTTERGSIFFFIMLGVALFATLVAVMNNGLRSSSQDLNTGSEEKMILALGELRNTALQSSTAIQTLTIEGFNIRHFNLYASGSDGVYYPWSSPNCTSPRCDFYSPTGYGLKYFLFSKAYPEFSGLPNVVDGFQYPQGLHLVAWANKGSLQADIIYRVKVTKNFCNFINKKVGITQDIDSLASINISTQSILRGDDPSSLAATSNYWAFGGDYYPTFSKKSEFCYPAGSAPPYQYIYVNLVYAY